MKRLHKHNKSQIFPYRAESAAYQISFLRYGSTAGLLNGNFARFDLYS